MRKEDYLIKEGADKTVINLLKNEDFGHMRIDLVKMSDTQKWLQKLQIEDKKSFSAITSIKKWYWLYTSGGIDALLPKTRSDLGESRVFSDDACRQIEAYRKQFPHITGKKIYEKLVEEGYVKKEEASLDSLYRYLKAAGLTRENMPPKECLSFEFEHANDCWQADTTFGPTILYEGKHRQTYLIVFIDDASRLIVHGEFFFEDNALNMQKAFQKAILKFGVPRRIFVDYTDVLTIPKY